MDRYVNSDADVTMVLQHFDEPPGSLVLEVGANEEKLVEILQGDGYQILGVDLRDFSGRPNHLTIPHAKSDFVVLAKFLTVFDCVISTSALEHFGLTVYGQKQRIENYDAQAVSAAWDLLAPGGSFYVTVPYGKEFIEEADWRVYDRESLETRIIQQFDVEEKIFFKSGECPGVPDVDGIVLEKDANKWSGKPPHLTVYLKLRKSEFA